MRTDRYTPVGWAGEGEAVMWQCDACGGAVLDRADHDRFHAAVSYDLDETSR